MKKLTSAIALSLACSAAAFAGTAVQSGKDYKHQIPPVDDTCFKAHEWQFDVFGQYSVGEAGRAGVFHDHGWGGGVGINYFLTRNLGLGVDAAWLDVKEDPRFSSNVVDGDSTALHSFSGSVIWRFPIDHLCLAPYVYVGGGFQVDGKQWASAHGGAGLEYRIRPDHFGVFVDGRWTYLGDRQEVNDINFFSARVGFRLLF
jgi:hypothetical protein